MSDSSSAELCPCGSGLAFAACCGPVLAGGAAATAEALMRSRYTAYVKRDYKHLGESLSVAQRADYSEADAREWAESAEWLGLEILETVGGGEGDEEGTVRFCARFRVGGEEREHLEVARFEREEGRWVYAGRVDEEAKPVRRAEPKVGRNEPCPCGSGKKFKKCHGAG